MSRIRAIANRIRRGDPVPLPLALALEACTPAVRLGMWRRAKQPRHRVNAHVVSFGNVTAGGTGKTPAVIERARAEIAKGRRVAVLTRGYAAPSGTRPFDSPELSGLSPYNALGDEAALILQRVPEAIVLKDADRVASAQRAIEKYGCDLLILDDGYQYLRLERDEDVVMIDATNPFGNGRLIPRGILREPLTALERATHVIVTHADRARDLDALTSRLAELAPHAPLRFTRHAPIAVHNLNADKRHPLEWLKGRELDMYCGIAYPERFRQTLTELGAVVHRAAAGSDHSTKSFDPRMIGWRGPLITTEKDAVRGNIPSGDDVFVLEIELRDFIK